MVVSDQRGKAWVMTEAAQVAEGIKVVFADGKEGVVPFADIKEAQGRIKSVELMDPSVVNIYTTEGKIEIPWDFARAYCDPEYRSQAEKDALKGRLLLAQRIAAARVKSGWTQEQLATAAGMDCSTIIRIENGEHSPRLETLGRIAKALGSRTLIGSPS